MMTTEKAEKSLEDQKADLRAEAIAARDLIGDRGMRSSVAAQNLTGWLAQNCGQAVIAGYWPIRGEVDPRPILAAHAGQGCLPAVIGMGQPLVFRRWTLGQPVQPGPFGTFQPNTAAEEVHPQVVIVPLLAFDSSGARLGYGGGFYDRSLQAMRAQASGGQFLAVGLGFADQQMPELPIGPYDQRLDLVVTETGIMQPETRS